MAGPLESLSSTPVDGITLQSPPAPIAVDDTYPSVTFCPMMCIPTRHTLSDIEEESKITRRFSGVKDNATETLSTSKWGDLIRSAKKLDRAMYILGCLQHKDGRGRPVLRCYDGYNLIRHLALSDKDPTSRMPIDMVYFLALKFFCFDDQGRRKELPESEQSFVPLLENSVPASMHYEADVMRPIPSRTNQLIVQAVALMGSMEADDSEVELKTIEDVELKRSHATQHSEQLVSFAKAHLEKTDPAEYVLWLANEAQLGVASAQFEMGVCLYNGKGIPKDETAAAGWFAKAAAQGDAGAQFELGLSLFRGEGVPKDEEAAVELFSKAAAQGDAGAQFELGLCLFLGEGIPQDEKMAVEWFTRAAAQGNALAQLNLGNCLFGGKGTAQDDGAAVSWFAKAATLGHALAQLNFGNCLSCGRGTSEDKEAAVEWFAKAADQGIPEAQRVLAHCYQIGYGTSLNLEIALKWYKAAANQGHAEAQHQIRLLSPYAEASGTMSAGGRAEGEETLEELLDPEDREKREREIGHSIKPKRKWDQDRSPHKE